MVDTCIRCIGPLTCRLLELANVQQPACARGHRLGGVLVPDRGLKDADELVTQFDLIADAVRTGHAVEGGPQDLAKVVGEGNMAVPSIEIGEADVDLAGIECREPRFEQLVDDEVVQAESNRGCGRWIQNSYPDGHNQTAGSCYTLHLTFVPVVALGPYNATDWAGPLPTSSDRELLTMSFPSRPEWRIMACG
jgi:hypothetical protein